MRKIKGGNPRPIPKSHRAVTPGEAMALAKAIIADDPMAQHWVESARDALCVIILLASQNEGEAK